jgi:hypothetical protein
MKQKPAKKPIEEIDESVKLALSKAEGGVKENSAK